MLSLVLWSVYPYITYVPRHTPVRGRALHANSVLGLRYQRTLPFYAAYTFITYR